MCVQGSAANYHVCVCMVAELIITCVQISFANYHVCVCVCARACVVRACVRVRVRVCMR